MKTDAAKKHGVLASVLLAASLLIAAVAFLDAAAAVEPVKKEYIIPGMPLGDVSAIGMSTPEFLDLMKKTFDTVAKKTGIRLTYKEVECDVDKKTGAMDCYKTFARLFKEGKADFSIEGPWGYVDSVDRGIPIKPLAAIAVDKKKTFQYCIYTRSADTGKIESVADLKGRPIGDACPDIGIHQILYENGIEHGNLDDFFGKRTFTPLTSALFSLVLNEVDSVCMNNGYLKFSKSRDKRFKNISKLYCTKEEYGSGPFVYREGINPEVLGKLKKLLLRMHKDPDFGEIRTLFIAINGFFVEVNDSDYDTTRALLKRAKDKGWLK